MLTDTEIRKAKPTEKQYKLYDKDGLFVLVAPTGGKLWRWKYRFQGKEKLMSLGKYPNVPLGAVRVRREQAAQLLASGVDPMEKREQDKTTERMQSESAFINIAEQWLEQWSSNKNAQHIERIQRSLAADIYPAIGARPIAEIEAPELVALAKSVEKRGANDVARRVLQTANQIFRFAIAHGYTKRNPAADFLASDVLKPMQKKNFARIEEKELPALLRAIEVYKGTPITRLAMKLMALTFVRTKELIGARWSEFDFQECQWNLPAQRMKMRTTHIVPLARQAIEILEMLHTITGENEYLFPGDRNTAKPMSNNTILKALERMGYKGRMTGHGFRGVASTILHGQGYDHQHIELQLAHVERDQVSAAYNHAQYLPQRKKMMQDWADYLERAQKGARVLPFAGIAG